ncbi:porin family protein [Mucilaginibacter calamicampi]|uniref:Porin family protein n=1 Tax=Mucilaginibacter calamicampi TaxID=1302352 RepID=A0ABW2YVJ0_9SPHI
MKKLLITLIAVLGICSFAQAQKSKGVEFGAGIGYNGSTILSEHNDRAEIRSGFNAALSIDKYFSDKWSLKVKAIYDQKGSNKSEVIDDDIVGFADISAHYISVPVMANWHFGKTRNWYLNVGPYAGFLLDAERSITYLGVKYPRSMTSQFNKVDAGLAYGVGVKLPLSKKLKFYVELDGQNGVTNIFGYRTDNSFNSRGSFNVGLNY